MGKKAGELTLAEASLLAGLPQAPAYWDPYSNWEGAKRRQGVVLALMAEQGYITRAEAEAAKAQELVLQPLRLDIKAPHFVIWIQQTLEQDYGTEVLYRSGLRVYTTLDSNWQTIAEEEIRAHLATLQDQNVTDAALVAMQPKTGEILAMVGSADFNNAEIAGQINMAVRPRQPGSSIKPITYLTAFEKGWTPATLIWDVTTEFRDGAGNPYVPTNYDGKEHGPVLVRNALAQSLNIPAVKTLDYVGLPAMLDTARRMGIASLTRADYGLSLTLGGGEVTLLEMVGAYARPGQRRAESASRGHPPHRGFERGRALGVPGPGRGAGGQRAACLPDHGHPGRQQGPEHRFLAGTTLSCSHGRPPRRRARPTTTAMPGPWATRPSLWRACGWETQTTRR